MEKRSHNNNEDQPEKRRALSRVIVEEMNVDHLQKLCSSLEPMLRRVVSEEFERAMTKFDVFPRSFASSSRQISGPDCRNLQLHFRTRLSLPLFAGLRVEGEQGATIGVVLIDANKDGPVTLGREASLKLEVVVLEGDFNEEDWMQEEFERHVVKERDGKAPLLFGDLFVVLKEGAGSLGELVFTDNSSWTRSKKFRLALRVASGGCDDGARVREAKTEAFTVKDHRGELYKKHYPPALNDEVWRLEKIGKDGANHKRLITEGISNVEDFLRKLVMDSAKLRAILGSCMSTKTWDVLVKHAKTCVLNGKLYVYYADESRTVGVMLNNIYELSGLICGDKYFSADSLSDSQKVYVDGLVKKAYENLSKVVEYDGETLLNFNQPDRVDISQTEHVFRASLVPPSQFPGSSLQGYNQLPTAQLQNSQAPFDSVLQQDQFMGIHQAQTTTGLALAPPPLQATGGFQDLGSSAHPENLDSLEDWLHQLDDYLLSDNDDNLLSDDDEFQRQQCHEKIDSDDMGQLFLYSIGSYQGDGPSFMQTIMTASFYEVDASWP